MLIGYGDETYDKEWGELFSKVADHVSEHIGIDEHSYGWCGHIVRYSSDETTKAINTVLETKDVALVVPVLVAYDEMFQKTSSAAASRSWKGAASETCPLPGRRVPARRRC